MSEPKSPVPEEAQLAADAGRHRRAPGELRTSFETAEILRQAALRRTASPAQRGWRAATNSATGRRLRPGRREQREREALEALRLPIGRPRTIMVANPKGGAGKTPTTLMLSAVLGAAHNGYVLGWDNNETRGTLGQRAEGTDADGASARDLLSALADSADEATMGSLVRYVRPQRSFFDVLPSDQDPARMAQIGFEEFGLLHHVLSRFYRLIVVDTGNNVRAPNWQAAAQAADALVVVSNYDWDSAHSALWMLDHLRAQGREDLAARAVTVLSAPERRVNRDARDELMLAFGGTAAILEIPYDRELSGGGEINVAALRRRTRQAWMNVGKAVCRQFEDADSPRVPATSIQLDRVPAVIAPDRTAAVSSPPAGRVELAGAVRPLGAGGPAEPATTPVPAEGAGGVGTELAGDAQSGRADEPGRPAPVKLAGVVQLLRPPAVAPVPADAQPEDGDEQPPKRRRLLGRGKKRRSARPDADEAPSPRSGSATVRQRVEPVGPPPPLGPIHQPRVVGL